jgi:3-deoxy-manno-octulosonate cytidylyltransferase (CMP-KDO synthetase)
MIQHVWERARKSLLLNDLLIACDDPLIEEAARKFGAKVVLTAKDHPSGSDRIAEAVKDLEVDVVINIQADEPLITPSIIDGLAQVMADHGSCTMATVIKVLTEENELKDPNVVKVVIDQNHNALYFSRTPIPYNRNQTGIQQPGYYKHLGLYAYRKDFLMTFVNLPQGELERIEQLEQLRALEAGYRIRTILTDIPMISVDIPADLIRVREFLSTRVS